MELPDRVAIETDQLTKLRALFAELLPANRFYTPRLEAATLDGNLASLTDFFARMPFTTKAELVQDHHEYPPFGTNLTYPIERYTRFCQTSGTSGLPLRWLDTPQSWAWMVENWLYVLQVAGITAADRMFFAFSFGPFLGFWTAFEAGTRLGCLCLPGGGMSSSARLSALLENEVTALCCTPTYAIRLGEVAIEQGIDLAQSSVHKIVVAGEPGAGIPTTRERIERLWHGAKLYDHHGMTETGPVSFPCPARQGVLHIRESDFIPEVIDPQTLQPVAPGEKGELILTNLGRVGSPLLRYRTGDLVLPSSETVCACGRSDLALEGGILGRTDDMVVVRGVNLYPAAFEEILRRFEEVAEYRVTLTTQQSMSEVAVQVEPLPDCSHPDALCHNIETALRVAFNLRVAVTSVPCETLPRFELKAKRWIVV